MLWYIYIAGLLNAMVYIIAGLLNAMVYIYIAGLLNAMVYIYSRTPKSYGIYT